jgi:hypothetical protein
MAAYQFILKLINPSIYSGYKKHCKYPCLRDHFITLFHLDFTLPSCEASASASLYHLVGDVFILTFDMSSVVLHAGLTK